MEEISSTLVEQVNTLSETIKSLNLTVAEQRVVINSYEETAEASINGISVEQERINNNIVVRGLLFEESVEESTLISAFENICTHIGVSSESELKPVSAKVIQLSSEKEGGPRPFIVSLVSREAKRKFLQARRIKRDIRPSEINHKQKSDKPIIVTEQLTKDNQKLLFEARSLRGRNKFKFIWSSHGQILARRKKRSTVIRIKDSSDVERLRVSLSRSEQNVNSRGTQPPNYGTTQE